MQVGAVVRVPVRDYTASTCSTAISSCARRGMVLVAGIDEQAETLMLDL